VSTPETKFTGRIRPAQPEDSARIAELATQLGYPSNPHDIARRLAQLQRSEESGVLVAQLRGGEIAGWIGMFVFRSISDDPRVEISGFVVDEDLRSQGIGGKLLEGAEQWAREKGYRAIGLRCNVLRERAHAFYLRHGYQHAKTQKSFRKVMCAGPEGGN
jgi:GNAT superfamily N-acetyltransferase